MKITLEATGLIEDVEGPAGRVRARIWKGKTEGGAEVVAWIALIGAPDGDDAELKRELSAIKLERRLSSFDMRVIS